MKVCLIGYSSFPQEATGGDHVIYAASVNAEAEGNDRTRAGVRWDTLRKQRPVQPIFVLNGDCREVSWFQSYGLPMMARNLVHLHYRERSTECSCAHASAASAWMDLGYSTSGLRRPLPIGSAHASSTSLPQGRDRRLSTFCYQKSQRTYWVWNMS
jgi:hypothetical protein